MFLKPTPERIEEELRRQQDAISPTCAPFRRRTPMEERGDYRMFWMNQGEKPVAVHVRSFRRAKLVVGLRTSVTAPPTLYVTGACADALRRVLHPGDDKDAVMQVHCTTQRGRTFVAVDVATLWGLLRTTLRRFLRLACEAEPRLRAMGICEDTATISLTNMNNTDDVVFISVLVSGVSDKDMKRILGNSNKCSGSGSGEVCLVDDKNPVGWLARIVLQRDGGARVTMNFEAADSPVAMMFYSHCVQALRYAITVGSEKPRLDDVFCIKCKTTSAPRWFWCRDCMGSVYCSRDCMKADAEVHAVRCGKDRLTLLL